MANLHNKQPCDAMSMLSRTMLLDLQANTKTCKDVPAWYKGQESGWAGKWVQRSHVTREHGWGNEKRSESLKVTFFSLTSFSSVAEWHHLSIESDQPRAMTWLFLFVHLPSIHFSTSSGLRDFCGLTIIIPNAGSRRQWSTFLTTKKVLRYDACAVKSDLCYTQGVLESAWERPLGEHFLTGFTFVTFTQASSHAVT